MAQQCGRAYAYCDPESFFITFEGAYAYCDPESFDLDVKGKVVVCDSGGPIDNVGKGQTVKNAGAIAMIITNNKIDGNYAVSDSHVLPASQVTYIDGLKIKAYIYSTSSPKATILFKGTVFGVSYAPQVADFSSRGSSVASPGILKPDIIGPDVDILATWPSLPPSTKDTDATFELLSRTSMACPHLAGAAALLKSTHPDWSPAAIKSAIMTTTATILNLGGNPITDIVFRSVHVFAIGAGHVNPSNGNDPGPVYGTQPEDYIPYLCGLNYTDQEIGVIVQHSVKYSNTSTILEAQLNNPSFSIRLGSTSQTFVYKNRNKCWSSYLIL